ncbi:cation-transporting P-type ATPase [bacterium]|nr:cation-transporting P-type ATPase [bacterium]
MNKYWTQSKGDILKKFDVDPQKGLSLSEAKKRLHQKGPNRLRAVKEKSSWTLLVNQLKNLIIILLFVASGMSFLLGEWIQGVAICVAIVIFIVIGFLTELRAVRSMESLRRMGRVTAKVRREGGVKKISAQQVVPGDILIVEGGDIVTADTRLTQASKLQVDESALTGESFPVKKHTQPVKEKVTLGERDNTLFKGTAVSQGSGEGVVVATGMHTELGHISSLVEEAEEEITPLEKRLNQLGQRLIWLTLMIAALVAAVGIVAGKEIYLMIETSIVLAVAAIPEGLPIVATIALARGVWRMARRNALVNRLSSVETLGSTNIICTDKTGTLTENQMTATQVVWDNGEISLKKNEGDSEPSSSMEKNSSPGFWNKIWEEIMTVGLLCNNASLQRNKQGEIQAVGEPLEAALLWTAEKGGYERYRLVQSMPEAREESFDPDVKMMATYNERDDGYYVAVKGAPESVLNVSQRVLTEEGERNFSHEDFDRWQRRNEQMTREGLRVLAFARKNTADINSNPYENLTLLGLIGFLDPPRQKVSDSVEKCLEAGIQVIMVTGDHPLTAHNIALKIGIVKNEKAEVIHSRDIKSTPDLTNGQRKRILGASIFARVSPKQKLDLIQLHQEEEAVVAMTGDGVNDAPALKKADIGVAMGGRGTQVAQEAADMILQDDAFSTIVSAVAQGRVIFHNIRKFMLYLLSCNLGALLTVGIASGVNLPLPVLPLQILFLNLVTDVFPALALGVGEGDPHIMENPPRGSKEPILTQMHWVSVGVHGILIALAALGGLVWSLQGFHMGKEEAVTVSFLILGFARVWNVLNMRNGNLGWIQNDVTKNPYIWGALALCVGLLLSAVYLPVLSEVLSVEVPGAAGWGLILGMSLIPLVVGQSLKSLKWVQP